MRRFGAILLPALAACAPSGFDARDVGYFQPPIVVERAPDRPLRESWSLANNTARVGLAPMRPTIPAYAGEGRLLASWTPHPAGAAGRPTFVIVHGGHGLTPTNFATALWLRQAFAANVLVLDSYWSRGREENWTTRNAFGANMRALDAIAAARWLVAQAGVAPDRLFLYGDSQGGWAVLRLFTDDPFFRREAGALYRAGVALYPVCRVDGSRTAPPLGPYAAPVLVFTGGRDTATPISECPRAALDGAAAWVHYPDQTHGWDSANRGAHSPAVDGECARAMNVLNRFPVCRSDATTADMRHRIVSFINGLLVSLR